jgi:phosphotransferase system HPr (HPr) family protein
MAGLALMSDMERRILLFRAGYVNPRGLRILRLPIARMGGRMGPVMRISVEAVVNDERGIHARPSALIVKASRAYPGTVTVCRADEPDAPEFDCKDMMSLIEMEAAYGTRVRFCIDTPEGLNLAELDEAEAQARAIGSRLVAVVSMTLEEIERLHMQGT